MTEKITQEQYQQDYLKSCEGLEFTSDWFSDCIPYFGNILQTLGKLDSILEIGCHEGRSTTWILQNMLSEKGEMFCVDPFMDFAISPNWKVDIPTPSADFQGRFNRNVEKCRLPTQNVNVMPLESYKALSFLISMDKKFDFIYIDGGHFSDMALTDACMAFGMLKPGGIMLFDDYLWDHVPDHFDRPKMGIDAFVNIFARYLKTTHVGYQYGIQKLESAR